LQQYSKNSFDNSSVSQLIANQVSTKPSVGDYRVIAVLDHTVSDTENIIHNLTLEDENPIKLPEKYRTSKSICEHCKSDRRRNKTVILQNKQEELIQVGTKCFFKLNISIRLISLFYLVFIFFSYRF